MTRDNRALFRLLRYMEAGAIPPSLVEMVLLDRLAATNPRCHEDQLEARGTEQREPLLRLLDSWYPGTDPSAGLKAAEDHLRLLKRSDLWAVRRNLVTDARSEAWHTPAFVAVLLDQSRRAFRSDPRSALGWAEVAERAAARRPASLIPSCHALAMAYRANAVRIGGQLAAAEALFRKAENHVRFAPPEPWIQGHFEHLVGSLLKDQRRLPEALERFQSAASRFLKESDPGSVAEARMNAAAVHRLSGDLPAAIAAIWSAEPYLDPLLSPQRTSWAHHNLAVYLCESGELQLATLIVQVLDDLQGLHQDPAAALSRLWLRGLIARETGQFESAIELLDEVVVQYVARETPLHAAIAAMDLALTWWQAGRPTELLDLARRLERILRDFGLPTEAIGSAVLLAKAAAAERVSLVLLHRIRRFFEELQVDPSTQFGE